jgi:SAM-dependent methyltransferase
MTSLLDPKRLKRQYATDKLSRDIVAMREKYAIPRIDFPLWALNGVLWRGEEKVLDVGCGFGQYYHKLYDRVPDAEYYGLDLFPGVLATHPGADSGRLAVADAIALPYPSATFDVVMANHMLYHVQDIDTALREIRRVLKPDGVLMATTHSVQTMPELRVLLRRAVIILTQQPPSAVRAPLAASDLFGLENGTRMLARHFYAVSRFEIPSTMIFTTLEPFLSYLNAMRDLLELYLPSDVSWDSIIDVLREQVTQLIHQWGEVPISRLAGVLVASDRGDFIRQFLTRREAISQG